MLIKINTKGGFAGDAAHITWPEALKGSIFATH